MRGFIDCIQYTMPEIEHGTLSDVVEQKLRIMLFDGALATQQNLNEEWLAGRLGVSRTPVREALSRMATDGLVRSEPRRGFFTRSFSDVEVREHYELLGVLEPAALAAGGVPDVPTLNRLAALNGKIAVAAGDLQATINLDAEWHLMLLAGCRNEELLRMVRRYLERRRLFDLAYLADARNVEIAVGEHDVVLHALRRGKLERAVDALRIHVLSAPSAR